MFRGSRVWFDAASMIQRLIFQILHTHMLFYDTICIQAFVAHEDLTHHNRARQAFDLVDAYESSPKGPLFRLGDFKRVGPIYIYIPHSRSYISLTLGPISPSLNSNCNHHYIVTFIFTLTQAGQPGTRNDGNAIHRAMVAVQQAIMDEVYNTGVVSECSELIFKGRGWQTAKYFPGHAPPPQSSSVVHHIKIQADVPKFWGRWVSYAEDAAQKPTGLYLSPGEIVRVTVPKALVNKGYQVQVGAHKYDHKWKTTYKRMDRVTVIRDIVEVTTVISSPLGGSVYILVPYLADDGLVTLQISGGVILSPFFQRTSFNQMTNADWEIRRDAPGPWTDFETDKFMLTVPTTWIYKFEDPEELMRIYDRSMDGVSEFMGYPPEKRNRKVLYIAVDTDIKANTVFSPGYPQVNHVYDPRTTNFGTGNNKVWLLQDPGPGWRICWHELGHAQQLLGYNGEGEALVNYLYTFLAHVKYNKKFDDAFDGGYKVDGQYLDPDSAAVDWMVTSNFRKGHEMEKSFGDFSQFAYQHRGFGKYADMTRLFGWEYFTSYYHEKNLAANDRVGRDTDMHKDDARTLHLSMAAKHDLTPLIHFWGIFPVNEDQLRDRIRAQGLPSSEQIRCLLVRYRGLVPKTNADFKAFTAKVYPTKQCSKDRRFHVGTRGFGWYCDNMVGYGTNNEGTMAVQRIDQILSKYFPDKTKASCAGVKTGAPDEGEVPRPKTWSWMSKYQKSSTNPTSSTTAPTTCAKCGTIKRSGKRTCCARDGAWFNKCGASGDLSSTYTWAEGVKACKSEFSSDLFFLTFNAHGPMHAKNLTWHFAFTVTSIYHLQSRS